MADAGVSADYGKRGPLDAQVQRASDDTGSRSLVGSGHLADDACENVAINRNLQLLRGVIRPHGQNVQIALNLHHVIEDQREILAVPDVQLNRAASRAIKPKQAVRVVVVDGDRGLRADFHPVALVLDFALVVRVADSR